MFRLYCHNLHLKRYHIQDYHQPSLYNIFGQSDLQMQNISHSAHQYSKDLGLQLPLSLSLYPHCQSQLLMLCNYTIQQVEYCLFFLFWQRLVKSNHWLHHNISYRIYQFVCYNVIFQNKYLRIHFLSMYFQLEIQDSSRTSSGQIHLCHSIFRLPNNQLS